MRLPANGREWFESLCRAGVFALLGYMILQTLLPPTEIVREKVTVARSADLAMLTRNAPSQEIHFTLDGTPGVVVRAWQRALRSAGSRISWSGDLKPIAISAKPNARPERGYTINSYAAANSIARIRDAISIIDSASPGSQFHASPVAVTSGPVTISVGRDSASVMLIDSVVLRPVLVIGKAGWETKFTLAALEEAGWTTSALVSIAPSVNTTQGAIASMDTAHYSAVVALDEFAASRSSEIASFVRSGGGLILGKAAARTQALSAFRVSTGVLATDRVGLSLDTVSRASAPLAPLNTKANAVPLEQRGREIAVAAMRVGFGRVAEIGYSDTWRWRMQGTPGSLADHRDWWSAMVSQVAYAPRISAAHSNDDRAPYADLVEVAGKSTAPIGGARQIDEPTSQLIWIALLASLLLIEWSSRRLRGVP